MIAPDSATITETAPPSNPMLVAREFLETFHAGRPPTLTYWRGSFYHWEGSYWAERSAASLQADLYHWLEGCSYTEWDPKAEEVKTKEWKPSRAKVGNVLEALQAVVYLPAEIEERKWIRYEQRWLADTLRHALLTTAGDFDDIPVQDGLLKASTRVLNSPTAAFFNLSALPFPTRALFQPQWDATRVYACPSWLEFLASVWPKDPESVALLQEWFGYILSGDTRQQKMLLMVGPPRSGKGTIARVLSALAGHRNTSGPTMASLVGPFGLAPLIGKTLAVVSDARFAGRDVGTAVERLLAISGEDDPEVDRKHKESWKGRLGVRFMLLTNELPRLTDVSGAIATRFVILEMGRSWLGKEDLGLQERLTAELPSILLWSLDGLDRLRKRGRFTTPESSKDAAEVLMDFTSPHMVFVRECCTVGPEFEAPTADVFTAWKDWCSSVGREHPGTEQTLGRDLRAVIPGMRTGQRKVEARDVRVYRGFKLGRPAPPPKPHPGKCPNCPRINAGHWPGNKVACECGHTYIRAATA